MPVFYDIDKAIETLKRIPTDLTFDTRKGDSDILWDYATDTDLIDLNIMSSLCHDEPIVAYTKEKLLFEVIVLKNRQIIIPAIRINGERPDWEFSTKKRKHLYCKMINRGKLMNLYVPAYGYDRFNKKWIPLYNMLNIAIQIIKKGE